MHNEIAERPNNALITLELSEWLSGEHGFFRSPEPPFIKAQNDLEAIQSWLALFEGQNHTQRSYTREAVRILQWAILNKQKPFSSLDTNDLKEYRLFLANPQPVELWIKPKKKKDKLDAAPGALDEVLADAIELTGQEKNLSRVTYQQVMCPFRGPLSPKIVCHTDVIIGILYKYLFNQRYLVHNPHHTLPKLKDQTASGQIDVNRSLSKSQWQYLLSYLDEKCVSTQGQDHVKWLRTRFIVTFFYVSGLRIHELAKAKISDISIVERNDNVQIWLNVLGKGNKLREVPLPKKALDDLDACWLLVNGVRYHTMPDMPIVPPLRKRGVDHFVQPQAIHKILKEFFKEAAEHLRIDKPESADKIARASAHWLRHTHGTHAIDSNISITILRDNLGHKNISTTSQYVHAGKDERHDAFTGMFGD